MIDQIKKEKVAQNLHLHILFKKIKNLLVIKKSNV